jgi:hypothetical protein
MKYFHWKKQGVEILGWYGSIALICGYFLVSFQFIEGESLVYQILNITGAFGLMTFSLCKRAYPLAFLNGFWGIIGCFALLRILYN